MKKTTFEQQTVDIRTGEVIKTYSESVVQREPDYVKLYLESITKLNDVQGWTDPILHELLRLMNYGNEIVLNAAVKKRMALGLKISTRTIDNALSMLVKKNIIFRVDTGLYKGNPFLFGKGEWRDIRELRMTVVFDKEGQNISTEVIKGDLETHEALIPVENELVLN
ncbi:MAG: replication/maintenance protein RepL [Stigonema ocellatum SAG 48.90 = DSM 106950]|nr:replication/maintenance protein RepL [Stigonema ocellatum SAG 48.90 = DSM 106950]